MEAFQEFIALFSGLNIKFSHVLVVGIAVGVFIFELVLVKKGILRFETGTKRRDQAIAAGHVVKAKRIRYYDDKETGHETNSHYYAKYEYTVEGTPRIYRYYSRQFPPVMLTLYYVRNPRRVFHYEKETSLSLLLLYIIPVAIVVLVVKIFGLTL